MNRISAAYSPNIRQTKPNAPTMQFGVNQSPQPLMQGDKDTITHLLQSNDADAKVLRRHLADLSKEEMIANMISFFSNFGDPDTKAFSAAFGLLGPTADANQLNTVKIAIQSLLSKITVMTPERVH